MPFEKLDRRRLIFKSLKERENRVELERDFIDPASGPGALSDAAAKVIDETAERMRVARHSSRPRMLAFGAHAIKNGLAPVLIRLLQTGWITHLATNGAGIIHDWEFAYQGASSENVEPT